MLKRYEDAADYLATRYGVTYTAGGLRNLVAWRKLPCYRVGGRTYLATEELDRFVEMGRVPAEVGPLAGVRTAQ